MRWLSNRKIKRMDRKMKFELSDNLIACLQVYHALRSIHKESTWQGTNWCLSNTFLRERSKLENSIEVQLDGRMEAKCFRWVISQNFWSMVHLWQLSQIVINNQLISQQSWMKIIIVKGSIIRLELVPGKTKQNSISLTKSRWADTEKEQ